MADQPDEDHVALRATHSGPTRRDIESRNALTCLILTFAGLKLLRRP